METIHMDLLLAMEAIVLDAPFNPKVGLGAQEAAVRQAFLILCSPWIKKQKKNGENIVFVHPSIQRQLPSTCTVNKEHMCSALS